jgi:predicted dehydrogenase
MGKIGIALVGSGYIADYHARALNKCKNVDLRAVVSRQSQSARDFAEKHHISASFTDIASIADRNDIDGVVLSTPNQLHAPHAIEFLQKGKDVFTEKPMAMNAREAAQINQVASAHGRLVMVGHMWRFDEEVNYIRDAIASGKLGKVIRTKSYGIHENWGPEGWFTRKELAGGGALADMGVHAIDTARYLIGDPEPDSVFARVGTDFGDYDVDDSGVIVVIWKNGVTSVIESGWWQPYSDGPEAATRLYGTAGYASVFPTFLKLKEQGAFRIVEGPKPEKREHCDQVIYDRQMAHFIDCIGKRSMPFPGYAEGTVIQEIVDAAYRSSETGEAVKF